MNIRSAGIGIVVVLLLSLLAPFAETEEGQSVLASGPERTEAMEDESNLTLAPISVGEEHACVVLSDGGVSCWGDNRNGLLGIGIQPTYDEFELEGIGFTAKPTNVSGLPSDDPIVQVMVGGQNTCTLASSGNVHCWGLGGFVGDSTVEDRSLPVRLDLGVGVSKLASSWIHTCALAVDGRVLCWGGASGGLGDGEDRDYREEAITPVFTGAFPEGRRAVDLAVATHGTCALLDNGSVSCWDDNDTPREGRVFGPGIKATALHSDPWYADSGTGRVCATLDNGSMPCWYPSGHGTPDWIDPAPEAIAIGPDHACIVDDQAIVMCRGSNTYGQLGDGTWDDRDNFSPVQGLPNNNPVVAIDTGETNTCVVVASGDAYCWGYHDGLNGDGTAWKAYEEPVKFDWHPELENITSIDGSRETNCAVHGDGALGCWGSNSQGLVGDGTDEAWFSEVHLMDQTTFGGKVMKITFSLTGQACALIDDGTVWCWGNAIGEEGGSIPTKVPEFGSLRPVVDVAVYSGGVCVVEETGHVSCWGEGGFGQIGNGQDENQQFPTRTAVFGPQLKALTVTASAGTPCARTDTNALWCWGYNFQGQVGAGSGNLWENRPLEVIFSDEALFVEDHASSIWGSCALLSDTSVHCWGSNYLGLLGQGNPDESSNTPLEVLNASNGASSLAGGMGMCVLLSNASMWCWADDLFGNPGDPIDAPSQRWEQIWLNHSDAHLAITYDQTACVVHPDEGLWCLGQHYFVDADFNRSTATLVEDVGGGRTVLVPAFDDDEDGIEDHLDNCPDVANPGQENLDLDAKGDACDDDDDNDGVLDEVDLCPRESDPQQTDTDSDGRGDVCDDDDDDDSLLDEADPCPLHHAVRDTNCNDVLDADEDQDGDGVLDDMDRCEGHPDADDMDGDGWPDGCDDSDRDGVVDAEDQCPDGDDAVDENQNTVPDACDEALDAPEEPEEPTNGTGDNLTSTDQDEEEVEPSTGSESDDRRAAVQREVILASGAGLMLFVGVVTVLLRRRQAATDEPPQLPVLDHDVEAYVAKLVAHGYAEQDARPYAVAYFQRLRHP